MSNDQKYCPCGGIILADTEDWKTPMCNECYEAFGEPRKDPHEVFPHRGVPRNMVSVHGSDDCLNCDTGRITVYAGSRWCLECQAKKSPDEHELGEKKK